MIDLTIRESTLVASLLTPKRHHPGNRGGLRMIGRIFDLVRGILKMAPVDLPHDSRCDRSPQRCATSADSASRARTFKLPQDTVQGCRDRAAADLLEAVTIITANQRLRLERSAQSWTVRADLLDRLDKSFEKRCALDRASKQYEIDRART